MDPERLNGVSCLMMSDTGLFLNFDPFWTSFGVERRERLLHEWEQNFEEALRDFQKNELGCYGKFGSGSVKDTLFVRGMFY